METQQLLLQITKDHAVTGEKLDRIQKDIAVLNERITKRETEIEIIANANVEVQNRITKLETTVDIFKFLIGGALSVGILALVEATFDLLK